MSFFNWFIDPIKNHYLDFSGRATRQAYWMFVLVYVLISMVVGVLEGLAGINFLGALFALATLAPVVALVARRLHDTGRSGWWQLLSLIPVVGTIAVIILLLRPGEAGTNQYGPSPLVATSSFTPGKPPARSGAV